MKYQEQVREIQKILNLPQDTQYYNIPKKLIFFIKNNDKETYSSICKSLLEIYLCSFNLELSKKNIPVSINNLYKIEFQRIYEEIEKNHLSYFDFMNDFYLKDLSLLRLKLIPVGAELVDVCGGIPRSLLFQEGVQHFMTSSYFFLLKTKGFKPFYELHLDMRNLTEFSPDGWDKTYIRLAELLSVNPKYKGFFGGSWFYDPSLESVSPHLSYLRKVRQQGGAQIFRWGSDAATVAMATNSSRTRKKMYESGQYMPCSYFLVWTREDLLRWAEKQ